jgi:hypothetical protein
MLTPLQRHLLSMEKHTRTQFAAPPTHTCLKCSTSARSCASTATTRASYSSRSRPSCCSAMSTAARAAMVSLLLVAMSSCGALCASCVVGFGWRVCVHVGAPGGRRSVHAGGGAMGFMGRATQRHTRPRRCPPRTSTESKASMESTTSWPVDASGCSSAGAGGMEPCSMRAHAASSRWLFHAQAAHAGQVAHTTHC